MNILGIETSCDDTALAAFDGSNEKLLLSLVHTQPNSHAKFGGIVPEIASRDHSKYILPLMYELLDKTGWNTKDIDAIAYTKGPGLPGALLVGASFAQTLGWGLGIKTIGIHHIEGHIAAPFLDKEIPFPFIALLVSGGHTQLYLVNDWFDYSLLGQSRDDAAGEAFDKCAKMIGLDYPGGKLLAKLAQTGDSKRFQLPRPMINNGLDFSFSGLKTAVLYTIKDLKKSDDFDKQAMCDMAACVEIAITEVLVSKSKAALEKTNTKRLVVSGGVSANIKLRESMQNICSRVDFPKLEYCTDNAAMIALAGYQRIKRGFSNKKYNISTKPRWNL